MAWQGPSCGGWNIEDKTYYTPSTKIKMDEGMLRKVTKVHVYVQCFSLFSKPERTSCSLTPQLDIIEVSSVKGLSLRDNSL